MFSPSGLRTLGNPVPAPPERDPKIIDTLATPMGVAYDRVSYSSDPGINPVVPIKDVRCVS